jgi:DNA-binding Lrp family transcriptional regulator
MVEIDEKDIKIIEALKKNARLSMQQISRKTLIPITTVFNRIKRLERLKVIKGYTVEIDQKKLGKLISGFILANVDYNDLKKYNLSQNGVGEMINKLSEVKSVTMMAGGTDLIIQVDVEDVEALSDFVTTKLRNIGGIEKTNTLIALREL